MLTDAQKRALEDAEHYTLRNCSLHYRGGWRTHREGRIHKAQTVCRLVKSGFLRWTVTGESAHLTDMGREALRVSAGAGNRD